MTTRAMMAAILGLALLTAVSACGRKGDLELPPGATPQAKADPGPTLEEVLGDDAPIDAEPLDEELDDIAPRRRVENYHY
ncbi:MAG: lipoprotein [Parvibaculaceae bacterium]